MAKRRVRLDPFTVEALQIFGGHIELPDGRTMDINGVAHGDKRTAKEERQNEPKAEENAFGLIPVICAFWGDVSIVMTFESIPTLQEAVNVVVSKRDKSFERSFQVQTERRQWEIIEQLVTTLRGAAGLRLAKDRAEEERRLSWQ